jgi:hypothetical protein
MRVITISLLWPFQTIFRQQLSGGKIFFFCLCNCGGYRAICFGCKDLRVVLGTSEER